jgi:hypothetical protein
MLRSIIQMLGLDLPVPDHTTLARRSARLSLTTALKKPKEPVTSGTVEKLGVSS